MKIRAVTALLTLLCLAACSPADDPLPPAETPAPAEAASATDVYARAAEHNARSDADRARDAGRKPAEVLAFLGIDPGMDVLDMYSGGGYYAELIARVVGPDGSVDAHNNQAYLGFAGDEIEARYAADRLPNVATLMAENNELNLEPGAYDAITMVLAYHDIYYISVENGWPEIDGPALLAEFYEGLKPGGIVGIVDHYAAEGAPTETGGTTHRIDREIVVREMQEAGFVLDASSDLLRNPDDDYSVSVFDPSIRGNSDRFLLRFRKPVG